MTLQPKNQKDPFTKDQAKDMILNGDGFRIASGKTLRSAQRQKNSICLRRGTSEDGLECVYTHVTHAMGESNSSVPLDEIDEAIDYAFNYIEKHL